MPHSIRQALDEARQRLEALYGDRLVQAILYGSRARGEARPDSDVDVLVILRGELDLFQEIERLTQLQLALEDRYDLRFSFQPFTEEAYLHRQSPFLINVRAEGTSL
ncbi:nucleotidyltransferase domain-containing protein [Rhodocaloribacter litoris]|uniref:nucleotidyltransferase domain-containing protein n=1 Tax=Rhodocaloribacter litoris TaxID=2558931 RepID=UPI0014213F90|nr:nucleotidyltransferase domain-containing protein [Rhodocaloribacter litoris]QXD16414.1 nucleotidyltransferase domain-containing protein [Rhodocaloribacter litoris]